MPLAPGAKLGPYEVVSPLGAGGMGEVYRARDTRLDRAVAIKVLPERFSEHPELRQRLGNEARTISKLSHPNICTLHDIGHHDGVDFLVFEFVEGKTLRQLITSNALPVRKILHIAVQIAEGLAQAHEAGIIHRDLKPENLMIAGELVKILDFGLAKLVSEAEEITDTETTVAADTSPGGVSGTLAYMSPEQARGQILDFRSDQFSFGLVLYEMATRKRAFKRSTQAQTLLAILQDDPRPITHVNPEIPPPLSWVVERCLAKEPQNRYFSTRDLVRDLSAIRDRVSDLQPHPPTPQLSSLPTPSSPLVGRDREVAGVTELLLRPEVRLVTITGPGGIGKSRLALEVARHIADDFSGGVHLVPLASITEPDSLATVIAQSLLVREKTPGPDLERLKESLQKTPNRPLLLLIDNFEHMISAAPVLAELLAAAPQLKLLVTSRAALRVYDEHEFPVPPLACPNSKSVASLDLLSQYSAVALFVQRAAAVKPDFKLTDENASAIVEICARLDGLPLAIELAAARIKLLSPAALRTRLESRLQLLTGGARDLPARQQTLRQAIDWSYDLLSGPEQRLFRRLSVFAGGCTLEAVESVCDTRRDLEIDLLDGMSSMVDKSLVRQIDQPDGEPRFVMLETLREYGLEKLAASGDEHFTRRAHAAYCLVLGEEAAASESGAETPEWQRRIDVEHDNFRAALEWLIENREIEWGFRLGAALFRFWESHDHFAEGRDYLQKLLKLDPSAPSTSLRARVLFAAGILASEQGDYGNGERLFQESLAISRQLDDKRGIVVCLNALAVNARDLGDIANSRSLFEQSLALWRQLRDQPAIARALSNLAAVVKVQEDFALARSLYEESGCIFRDLGDRTGVAWALNHQGDVVREQGDLAAAQSFYERSLAAFHELKDRWGIAGSLADLGNLAREQRDFTTASSLYRESLTVFQDLNHKRGVARLLEAFACLAAAQSQPERALRLAGSAAALRQSVGAPLTPAEQNKLERFLELAKRALPTAAARTAWLEGWVMPVERATESVLSSS